MIDTAAQLAVLVTLWADPYHMEGVVMNATICEAHLRQIPLKAQPPVSECMPLDWWVDQQKKDPERVHTRRLR